MTDYLVVCRVWSMQNAVLYMILRIDRTISRDASYDESVTPRPERVSARDGSRVIVSDAM